MNENVYKLIRGRRRITKLPIHSENGNRLITDEEISNDLANTFASAHRNPLAEANPGFTKRIRNEVKTFLKDNEHVPCPNNTIPEVTTTIKALKSNKAPGPDSLTNQLIKNLPSKAIEFITNIFNCCLSTGYFPQAWKAANCVAIPKQGKDHTQSKGYRPISLINTLSKIFERIIHSHLKTWLDESAIIPQEQFGFRRGHSTTHQLKRVSDIIDQKLGAKKSVGIMTLDIEKAFDSVWQEGLIHKLIRKRCPPFLIRIIHSFIKKRTFQVKCGAATSSPKPVPFGVPQGSVLSPSLYNIYVHDIPTGKNCERALFADDTAIMSTSSVCSAIENNLKKYHKKLTNYFERWKIKTNNDKTQIIFCTNRISKQIPLGPLTLDDNEIEWSNSVKYLGYHITVYPT